MSIAARLSALPEERILDYFWLMRRQGAEPIALLTELGAVRVWRPRGWDARHVRLEHDTTERARVEPVCFGCCRVDGLVTHHVVQIQHGGSNDTRNLVWLCYACHRRVHPWLDGKAPVRGFEGLGDIMRRAWAGVRRRIA
jgi:hypothetical protein